MPLIILIKIRFVDGTQDRTEKDSCIDLEIPVLLMAKRKLRIRFQQNIETHLSVNKRLLS